MPTTKTAYDEYIVKDTFEKAIDLLKKSRKGPGEANLERVLKEAAEVILTSRMELAREEIQSNHRNLIEALTEWDRTRKPVRVKWGKTDDEALRWKA